MSAEHNYKKTLHLIQATSWYRHYFCTQFIPLWPLFFISVKYRPPQFCITFFVFFHFTFTYPSIHQVAYHIHLERTCVCGGSVNIHVKLICHGKFLTMSWRWWIILLFFYYLHEIISWWVVSTLVECDSAIEQNSSWWRSKQWMTEGD